MSEPTQGQENQDLFTETTKEITVDDLVGEGKKYKTAEDALASIPHAQTHIASLERQLKEMRETYESKSSQEELLKQVLEKLSGQTSREEPADQSAVQSKGEAETPDIATLIKQTAAEELPRLFSDLTKKQKAEENVARVTRELVERFGGADEARKAMANKAKELGLSGEELRQLAAGSPTAVLAYFPRSGDSRATQGSVNTSAMPSTDSSTRNYEYYDKLRKQDPKRYFDPKVQLQLQKDAQAMGEAFFN